MSPNKEHKKNPQKNKTCKQNGGVFELFANYLKDGKKNDDISGHVNDEHVGQHSTGGKKKSKHSKTSKKSSKKSSGLKKMKKSVSKKMFKFF
jgi:hypothetical protein